MIDGPCPRPSTVCLGFGTFVREVEEDVIVLVSLVCSSSLSEDWILSRRAFFSLLSPNNVLLSRFLGRSHTSRSRDFFFDDDRKKQCGCNRVQRHSRALYDGPLLAELHHRSCTIHIVHEALSIIQLQMLAHANRMTGLEYHCF